MSHKYQVYLKLTKILTIQQTHRNTSIQSIQGSFTQTHTHTYPHTPHKHATFSVKKFQSRNHRKYKSKVHSHSHSNTHTHTHTPHKHTTQTHTHTHITHILCQVENSLATQIIQTMRTEAIHSLSLSLSHTHTLSHSLPHSLLRLTKKTSNTINSKGESSVSSDYSEVHPRSTEMPSVCNVYIPGSLLNSVQLNFIYIVPKQSKLSQGALQSPGPDMSLV